MEQVIQLAVVIFAALATGPLMVNWLALGARCWSVESPPDDWSTVRSRWIRFHVVRTPFSLPGLAFYILSWFVS